ncbi:uncharacterized protein LAESUDRAFT_714724 [Laetiporus sulphureus 93-53]|uniref:Uncharacterized protein n=1 Tax=Laetiporus sulphureus 93-53 TaxID=1314785 RepID=A0A165DW58_9APHY|nr:uncharacterized protein LAESUDRAFT_714724 [Laetiporus sulphureus 93-53]KZT05751.1 hypothetical protein LAESUDRAFT_714724 [Laetiporus sulphureus 93-53]
MLATYVLVPHIKDDRRKVPSVLSAATLDLCSKPSIIRVVTPARPSSSSNHHHTAAKPSDSSNAVVKVKAKPTSQKPSATKTSTPVKKAHTVTTTSKSASSHVRVP